MSDMITVGPLSNHLGVAPDSVRRWTENYRAYLTKSANPAKGYERSYSRHDAAVILYVHMQRETGLRHKEIETRLRELRDNNWADLPAAPEVWFSEDNDARIAISEASKNAASLAELSGLQVEVENLRDRLETALERAESAERNLEDLRARHNATQAQFHAVEVELTQARGEITTLQAQLELTQARGEIETEKVRSEAEALRAKLSAYSLRGDQPLPVVVIILGAMVAAVMIVVLVFIVARLLL